jgi:uncharacterized protein YoaH (UPF0181 family)
MKNGKPPDNKQNKKLDDKTPLTWAQIRQGIKEYNINDEATELLKRLSVTDFSITTETLKGLAGLKPMTKELLAEKIKEYDVPQKAVNYIYSLLNRGFSIDNITINMLKDIGKHGLNGSGGLVLHMLNGCPAHKLTENYKFERYVQSPLIDKSEKMKHEDKNSLTWEQIQEKIKKYKINQEGIEIINYGLNIGDTWTDDELKYLAKLHYMTRELLDKKIKQYNVPQNAVERIYSLINKGLSYDKITIEMLKYLGELGMHGRGGWALHMLEETPPHIFD